jgi:thioredoxin reductase (NADPH)
LRDGKLLFQAVTRDYKFFVVERGVVEIVEDSSGEPKTAAMHEVHEFGGDVDLLSGRPALSELLLRAFIARCELLVASDFLGLRVLEAGSTCDTLRIRGYLSRNQVQFTWIDVDHDPQVGELSVLWAQ